MMHSTDIVTPIGSTSDLAETALHGPSNDTLLQLSRRIDWRFLLPDPELGRVACFGASDELLVSALKRFSAALTLVEVDAPPLHACKRRLQHGAGGQEVFQGGQALPETRPSAYEVFQGGFARPAAYDVVVAHIPSPELLQRAAASVQPGGFLYVEARRLSAFKAVWSAWNRRNAPQAPGRQHPRHYMRALEQYGMVDIAAYWHWPGFTTATEIIPLADQTALLNAFKRRRHSRRMRLKPLIGRWLLQTGGLMQLVRCFSIVARRPPAGSL